MCSVLLIKKYKYNYFNFRKGLTNERPLSIIKLFFKLRFAQATRSQLVSTWVVLLSKLLCKLEKFSYIFKLVTPQIVLEASYRLCTASA